MSEFLVFLNSSSAFTWVNYWDGFSNFRYFKTIKFVHKINSNKLIIRRSLQVELVPSNFFTLFVDDKLEGKNTSRVTSVYSSFPLSSKTT